MAEELKSEGAGKKILATIFKVILGLALLAIGCLFILIWWKLLLMIVKGCIGLFFILAGIITLAIAKE